MSGGRKRGRGTCRARVQADLRLPTGRWDLKGTKATLRTEWGLAAGGCPHLSGAHVCR